MKLWHHRLLWLYFISHTGNIYGQWLCQVYRVYFGANFGCIYLGGIPNSCGYYPTESVFRRVHGASRSQKSRGSVEIRSAICGLYCNRCLYRLSFPCSADWANLDLWVLALSLSLWGLLCTPSIGRSFCQILKCLDMLQRLTFMLSLFYPPPLHKVLWFWPRHLQHVKCYE